MKEATIKKTSRDSKRNRDWHKERRLERKNKKIRDEFWMRVVFDKEDENNDR